MRYRNKRTGIVIDIESKLSGGDWEEVKASSRSPRKKGGDQNGTICDNK